MKHGLDLSAVCNLSQLEQSRHQLAKVLEKAVGVQLVKQPNIIKLRPMPIKELNQFQKAQEAFKRL